MPTPDPSSTRNLDRYGVPPIDWARVRPELEAAEPQDPGRPTHWLTTTNPDGSPHVMPLGVISIGGTWYFTSGPGTRKSRNIGRDPRCVVALATQPFDLVVEGTAERVLDAAELRTVAEAYAAHGWPASATDEGVTAEYSAPSAGPPPWYVYRVTPSTVYALGTAEPYGATRFDLT
jgi:pyridoxamine 5'-phosphate oxidase-like protein